MLPETNKLFTKMQKTPFEDKKSKNYFHRVFNICPKTFCVEGKKFIISGLSKKVWGKVHAQKTAFSVSGKELR